MKMHAYSAAIAAIAVAGFAGLDVPFASVSAYAQEAVVIAEVAKQFTPDKNLDLTGERLVYQNLPAGVTAKIVGTTYEQLISFEGDIRNPIAPKTTKITFELTDASGQKALTPTFEVSVPMNGAIVRELMRDKPRNPKPTVIPALQEWLGRPQLPPLGSMPRRCGVR